MTGGGLKGIAAIDDYVSGAMSDGDAELLEESMFAAAGADGDAALVDRVARTAAHLVPRGTYDMGITRDKLEELQARGVRLQVIDAGPPGHVTMQLRRDVEMIVIRYDVGLVGVERVDVELAVPSLGVSKVMRDVRVDADGAIYGACEAALAIMGFTLGQVVTGGTVMRDGVEQSLSYVIDAVAV